RDLIVTGVQTCALPIFAEQLSKARELVDLTLQEARAAISGLRPPVLDDLGLSGGLASLARSIPQIDMEIDLDDTRLPDHIELAQIGRASCRERGEVSVG